MIPIRLADFEALARARLTPEVFDYVAGGAGDEVTMAENLAALARLRLRPRVLVDVSSVSLTTTVLGQAAALPFGVAPMAYQGLAHPDAERATAAAAAQIGALFVLSTLANAPVADVAAAAGGRFWFQLYVLKDRGATLALVQTAERAGATALVVTVDVPMLGRRERDVRRGGFALPAGLSCANLSADEQTLLGAGTAGASLERHARARFDASLAWPDLAWLRARTALPILVKGVLRGDDAERAVGAGAAGVIVSNHGGRQLDGAVAAAQALPEVARAVSGRAAVLMDGGIRRGSDVVKALALGAQAVLVGRPVLWGLAAAGRQGVFDVLSLLRDELELAMALCGCPNVQAITPDLIAPAVAAPGG